MMQLNDDARKRLIELTRTAVEKFNSGDWKTIGVHTGRLDLITGHERLLRSLDWGDPDYSGNAHTVLYKLVEIDPRNLEVIEDYIAEHYGQPGEYVSSGPAKRRTITFLPAVFEIPTSGVERDLVSVMMPFNAEFEQVFESIKAACATSGYRALRAKDIWQHSSVIQDVFSLIFTSQIVICDFTSKNPNVFYEAGIAHTLGKHVVPITQSQADIPFDLQHHRYLAYLNNEQGREALQSGIAKRLRSFV